jgi:hypothetical protein
MTTRTTCDNCQQEIKIETGFALWRRDTEAKEADFCDLTCLSEWANVQDTINREPRKGRRDER